MPSTAATVPSHRTQLDRRTEAEQRLLDAASRLFAARGIDRTSLADIGEEAGYSRGLVNHHFGSKAVLVERLAEQAQQSFVQELDPITDAEAVDALAKVADTYLRVVEQANDHVRVFFVMWGAALPDDAAVGGVFVAADRRFRSGVEELVTAGLQRGTISREVDAAGFAAAFVGLVRGVAAQFLVDRDGVDLAAARVACERFVRQSLMPHASRGPR